LDYPDAFSRLETVTILKVVHFQNVVPKWIC
jgi:hypothetical protein